MTQLIAFYGTLMHHGNSPISAQLARDLSYQSSCVIPGQIYDCGRYPALALKTGSVEGELYQIKNEAILGLLDKYELHDNANSSLPGFTRKLITLRQPVTKAWVYVYDGDTSGKKLLATGRWKPNSRTALKPPAKNDAHHKDQAQQNRSH